MVVMVFLKNKRAGSSNDYDSILPFQPQTADQLFARIDHSIAQIGSYECQDAEEFEDEIFAEIESW